MGWKERLKPRNKTEAGCYKAPIFIALMIGYIILNMYVRGVLRNGGFVARVTVVSLFALIVLVIVARHIIKDTNHVFAFTKWQSIVVGTATAVPLLILTLGSFIGLAELLRAQDFLPYALTFLLWSASLIWLMSKVEPLAATIRHFLLQYLLRIPPETFPKRKKIKLF